MLATGTLAPLEEDARLTALFLWTLQSTGDTATESDEDLDVTQTRVSGFSLPFDVARRFAQPLGIHLDEWESRIISTEKGVVKLRPVTDRAKELFGGSGADALADEIETSATASAQLSLFPEQAPTVRGRSLRQGRMATLTDEDSETRREATTLDRVHAAMLFQASGRTEALRNLLRAEQDRGPEFPPAGQRPISPLPTGQRGKTTAGRDAAGSAEVTTHTPRREAMLDNRELLKRITARTDVFGGKPIIRDMRISVELILGLMSQGATPGGTFGRLPGAGTGRHPGLHRLRPHRHIGCHAGPSFGHRTVKFIVDRCAGRGVAPRRRTRRSRHQEPGAGPRGHGPAGTSLIGKPGPDHGR